ncbi:Olfactory receptor 13H1 [Galemys pyrenaicus]|uniref:Olfactory receptor 13H1 n=1 Tax=Galemys pyrenaicus TaxID=202257 RepID=A0A8J6AM77_GALPY|nr:Olfactory receptor 13H1 [Galemys pyrenaicus]
MAYDHAIAISNPLSYSMVMNGPVCVWLADTSWGAALVLTAMLIFSLQLHFCEVNIINRCACENLFLLKLACSDTSINELMLLLIIDTYGFYPLAQSKLKAFSTCGSHVTVATIFYVAAISIYMKPPSTSSCDQDKFISAFYGNLGPTLNPLIYSLKNKDHMRLVTIAYFQMVITLSQGITECLLPTLMTYDRFIALHHHCEQPSLYTVGHRELGQYLPFSNSTSWSNID